VKIILILIAAIYIYALLSNLIVARSENGKNFSSGKVPSIPAGFHKGKAPNQGSWLGKKFDATSSSGINEFSEGEKYPFKMYVSSGVLKIDYNNSQNPLWVRFILDELVEVDNHYLGRIQVLLPFYPITIGFFTLEN